MSQMLGADVAELRELSTKIETSSDQLRTLAADITGAVARSSWCGPDYDKFNSEWTSTHQPRTLNVAALLSAAATALQRNADEQDQASNSLGGGSDTGTGTGPGSGPGTGECLETCRFTGLPGAANEFFQNDGVSWAMLGADMWFTRNDIFKAVLEAGGELGDDLTKYFKYTGIAGKVLTGLGIGADVLAMSQAVACGDAYGAVDRGVSAVLGGLSFVPGPVGWVATGLNIGWNLWDNLNGDASPSQQIVEGVSTAWNWFTGLF